MQVVANVVVAGKNQKELFESLASAAEVFGETNCGKCNGTDLRYVVREVEDNKFYELRCSNSKCKAKLAFGAHKKGDTLFPKRKDKEGNYLGKNGWVIYDPETKTES